MYVLSEWVWLTVGLESGRMLTGTYVGVLRRVHLMTSGCGLYRGGEESRKDLRVMQLESLTQLMRVKRCDFVGVQFAIWDLQYRYAWLCT